MDELKLIRAARQARSDFVRGGSVAIMGKAERPGCRAGRSQGSLKRPERLARFSRAIGSRGHLGYLTQRFGIRIRKHAKPFLVLVGSGTPQSGSPLCHLRAYAQGSEAHLFGETARQIQPAHVAFDYAKRDFSADREAEQTTHVAGLHAPPHRHMTFGDNLSQTSSPAIWSLQRLWNPVCVIGVDQASSRCQ